MLERGSKVFSCFLDVRKAFDTVWIDGLLYKLFNDFGIKGRMWLAIKDLYTDVKAQVLYSGELSREFDVSQGTGQGRIFAPFMYKVYINSLLQKLSNHCYAISINSLSLPAPSFADDVTLLALFPSFLKTFLNICHQYSVTWRFEFNHTKSGVVTFGKNKPIYSRLMKEREWTLGDIKVDELYEYKNLGVLKNYAGSFTSNILYNIEKTRKKAGMIFSSDFDHRKTKPLIYIKFWKQACLPCLLFGAELFSLNKSQLCQLERCLKLSAETFQLSESYMYADCTGESLKKVNEACYKISKKYMRRKHYSRFVPSSIMLGNIKTLLQAFIFC